MQRREFITLLGGAAVAWPIAARARQPTMPVIGFLNAGSPAERVHLVAAFRKGLSETGYVEGRTVAIEYRWAENQYDRLPALADDLIHRHVAVIVTIGTTPATLAAKSATTTIPIIFGGGVDPVKLGLVASLNHPGGNLTGVSFLASALPPKQLDLLHKLIPGAAVAGFLVNPNYADTADQLRDVQTAADALGQKLVVAKASTERDLASAFSVFVQQRVGAILVQTEPFFFSRREQLAGLAIRHMLPAMFSLREYAEAGGLISYGANLVDVFRLGGIYTGRVLKGEKPANLPVQQSTKIEMVINLKTAKTLGLEIPPTVLALADEVIE